MKKLALAAALSISTSTAFAGGMAEPIMEPTPVVEEAAGTSSAGVIVAVLALLLIGVAASN